mmetsp:Transcript_10606/g.22991  ORF Transcript_10606/g.22991 Transcript_10606/m.22991 type:complete len:491 (-) Transcript_10606:56-1528(-)
MTSMTLPQQQRHIDARIAEIDACRYGNPSVAAGSFGEVTVALYRRRRKSPPNGSKDLPQCANIDGSWWDYAAVKTIRNAVLSTSSVENRCGGMTMAPSWGIAGATGAHDQVSSINATNVTEVPQLTREAFAEVSALRALSGKHPCIVPLLAVYPSTSGLNAGMGLSLAFPYCPIDLSSALQHLRYNVGPSGGMVSDSVVKAIFRDIMSALKHCHEHGVVHGDVNPANFLVSDTGRVQLSDFGLASACPSLVGKEGNEYGTNNSNGDDGDEKLPTHALCAVSYRAPEIMLGETTPHPSMDIWGAGLVLCEVLSLRRAFEGRNVIDQLNRIFDVLGTPSDSLWPTASALPDFQKISFDSRVPRGMISVVPRATICDDLQSVIDATVSLDPAKRISAAMCLEMPWLASIPLLASPCNVLEELVPEELIASPCVSPDWTDEGVDLDRAKQRAVLVASARRGHSEPKVKGHGYNNSDETEFQCRVSANGLLRALA